jgi:hypothetical protein
MRNDEAQDDPVGIPRGSYLHTGKSSFRFTEIGVTVARQDLVKRALLLIAARSGPKAQDKSMRRTVECGGMSEQRSASDRLVTVFDCS